MVLVTTGDCDTDRWFSQLLNCCDQLFNGLLQTSYLVLIILEGGLLKTRKTLEFKNISLQLLILISPMVNLILSLFLLLGKDPVVLQDGFLNLIGGS